MFHEAMTAAKSQPWVTRLVIVACGGIWLSLVLLNDYENWQTVATFGYLPPNDIWRGKLWGLITSSLVHFDLWHLWLNVSATWILGSRMEAAIGSGRYFLFLMMAAFISATFELAASDSTGIGFSGVGYAIFGFMWITKDRFDNFQDVMTSQNIQLFL